MPNPFVQMLRDWQNFYILTGTASATLVGLIFVAVTFGCNLVPQDDRATANTWVTPTIIHFATVLVFAVVLSVPTLTAEWLGLLLVLFGLAGLTYVAQVGYQMLQKKYTSDFAGRVWHVVLPFVSHVFVLSTAISLLSNVAPSLNGLAISTTILLAVGVRNAW